MLAAVIPTAYVTAESEKKPIKGSSTGETDGGSVEFLGTVMVLKEKQKAKTQYIAEYLPAGETFDNYTKMFAVWGWLDGADAASQAKAKVQFVNSRKGKDLVANYKLYKADDGASFGLDFLISEGRIMEHNVWYFTNVNGGVLAYQYVRRNYNKTFPYVCGRVY